MIERPKGRSLLVMTTDTVTVWSFVLPNFVLFTEAHNTVADPGFPRGGGANSPGGTPTYDFAKFSPKLHEIERIWTPGGVRPKFYYVDPPLQY